MYHNHYSRRIIQSLSEARMEYDRKYYLAYELILIVLHYDK